MPNIMVSLRFHGDSGKAAQDAICVLRRFQPPFPEEAERLDYLDDPEIRQKAAALRLRGLGGPGELPDLLVSDETEFSIEDDGNVSIRDCFCAYADALKLILAHHRCVSQISGTVFVRERKDCLIFAAQADQWACSEWLAKKTRGMMGFPF